MINSIYSWQNFYQEIWGTLFLLPAVKLKQKQSKQNKIWWLVATSTHFVIRSKLCARKINITRSKLSFLFGLDTLLENQDPCLFWLFVAMVTLCVCNTLIFMSMFTGISQLSSVSHCGNRNRPVVAQGSVLRNWDTHCMPSNKFEM